MGNSRKGEERRFAAPILASVDGSTSHRGRHQSRRTNRQSREPTCIQNTGLLAEWWPENPLEDDVDQDYVYNENEDESDYGDIDWDETLDEDNDSTNPDDAPEQGTVAMENNGVDKDSFQMNIMVDDLVIEEDALIDTDGATFDDNVPEPPENRYNLRPS
jgi:hypothetical protein